MVPLTGHFSLDCGALLYFRSWLIQLNKSYNYNGKIDRTGISTFNDHISEPESEKLKSLDPICFSILGLSFFRTFPQCIFRHFWAIFYHFLPFCNWAFAINFCEPSFQEFRLKWWCKELFCIVGTSWMGWSRVGWDWQLGMYFFLPPWMPGPTLNFKAKSKTGSF